MTQWVRTLTSMFDDLRYILRCNSVDEENRCLSIISSWTRNTILQNLIITLLFKEIHVNHSKF